jgi:hypothetical protein
MGKRAVLTLCWNEDTVTDNKTIVFLESTAHTIGVWSTALKTERPVQLHDSLAGQQLGNVQLVSWVNSSLWSSCYQGILSQQKTPVLVEVLHEKWNERPSVRDWWLEEARNSLHLQSSHPDNGWHRLLAVVDGEDHLPFLVYQSESDFVPLLDWTGSVDEATAALLALQLATLLDAAHRADLSVAIGEQGLWISADALQLHWKREPLVASSSLLMEQRYARQSLLAPEEIKATGFVFSNASDYYSLGQILLFLQTGEFHDNRGLFKPLPALSSAMNSVLTALLESVPERRLASLHTLKRQLEPWLQKEQPTEKQAPATEVLPVFSPTPPSVPDSAPTPAPSFSSAQEDVTDLAPPTLRVGGLDRSYNKATLPVAQPIPILEKGEEKQSSSAFDDEATERLELSLREQALADELFAEQEEELDDALIIAEEILEEPPVVEELGEALQFEESEASLPVELTEPPVPTPSAAPAPSQPAPARREKAGSAPRKGPTGGIQVPNALEKRELEAGELELIQSDRRIGSGERVVEVLRRKGVVRYYEQMNPNKNFPLLVSLIEASLFLRVPEMTNQKQAESDRVLEIKESSPHIRIVPVIPGCLVSPAEAVVDVRSKKVDTEFWVSPQAIGDLSRSARIQLWHEGQLKDEIPIPCRVVTQTWSRLTSGFSVMSGVGGTLIEAYSKPKAAAAVAGGKKSFVVTVLKKLIAVFGTSGLTIALGFLLLSAFLYFWFKPRQGEEIEHLLNPQLH